MTRSFILHIGAEKCASSSIQQSLRDLGKSKEDLYSFCELNPWLINRAVSTNSPASAKDFTGRVDSLIQQAQSLHHLIISHEVFCKLPEAVNLTCERAVSSGQFDRIIVIGYTRSHASFFSSAFRQWHFRKPKLLRSNIDLFNRLGINWELFTASERFLFAKVWALVNQKPSSLEMSWFDYYQTISAMLKKLDFDHKIHSNHIPSKRLPYSIFLDFLTATGIEVDPSLASRCEAHTNSSFYPPLTEAIGAVLCDTNQDTSMIPSAHRGNNLLFRLGDEMKGILAGDHVTLSPDFSNFCEAILDDIYHEDNLHYCQLMNVDPKAFPPNHALTFSKQSLLSRALQVQAERNFVDIQSQRTLFIEAFRKASHAINQRRPNAKPLPA